MASQARRLFYLDSERCRVRGARGRGELDRRLRTVTGCLMNPFPIRRAQPFDAGTLLSLDVQSFRV